MKMGTRRDAADGGISPDPLDGVDRYFIALIFEDSLVWVKDHPAASTDGAADADDASQFPKLREHEWRHPAVVRLIFGSY